ncbi:response regulator [Taibaiella lutea]|uniref:Response regulator n=1 Tax=Taibaiella lutea TaxID=2608001 RepID=A0A5M6CT35_9BACT|nr:response regulator [Taibaiella lutea]KAA5536185.1 response regulator [Taibaiella lutea]
MQKVLIIEDNAEIRENMAEILDLAGYEVSTAGNGKEGVAIAKKLVPDLIICDIMMPVLDGYGVLHMLQENQSLQNIPFIFLTAKSERSEVRKGMELGADDYIIKPFDGTDLLNAVARRLKKAAALKKQLSDTMDGVHQLIELSFDKDYLSELKEGRNTNNHKRKQLIYAEGNHPSMLFYILKGKVKTYKRNEEGKELIVGLYNKGDFLGYMALLEGDIYRQSAEALEDTELAVIPRSEFDDLIEKNPEIMKKFIGILARNINDKEEQLLAIAYNSLRKKVADTLIVLQRKYNSEKEEDYTIDLSRDTLAAIAGVAKESLIRMLGELKDENLISIESSRIKIINLRILEEMYN